MTSRPRTLTASVVLAALAVATTGCTNGDVGPSTPLPPNTPVTTSAAPVTSTAPTPTPEQAAIEAATKLIPAYFEAKDEVLRNPKSADPNGFKTVAISSALIDLQNILSAANAQKVHQTGSTTLVSMDNPRVDLALNTKKTPPDVPTVQLDTCYDVSTVDVVDKDGKSVIPVDRPDRGVMHVGVSNYSYPTPDQWRVSYANILDGRQC